MVQADHEAPAFRSNLFVLCSGQLDLRLTIRSAALAAVLGAAVLVNGLDAHSSDPLIALAGPNLVSYPVPAVTVQLTSRAEGP